MVVGAEVRLADGVRLWTAASTLAGAPALVLLHGGAGMWDYLEPLAATVTDLVTTHRYDQRGCGRSSPHTEHSLSRYVADLEELRTAWGHERWTLFGHSSGAALALAYAATHPEVVDALVWCSGTGLDWPSHRDEHQQHARARLTDDQGARRDELARRGQRGRTWEEEVEWRSLCWLPDFADTPEVPERARAAAETPLPLNLDANAAFNAELDARSTAAELAECARVRAPVLVLRGAEDPRPIAGVHALVRAVPSAELVVVEGAGHQPWVERPQETRDVLRAFLSAHA